MSKYFTVVVVSLGVLALAFSCTSTLPVEHRVGDRVYAQSTKKFFGIPVGTNREEIKTPEQAKADLEVKAMEDQQNTEAARARVAMWLGAILLAAAVVCAVVGYLTKGYKRWGGLCLLCLGACAFCWGFVEWIDYLKWLALLLPAVAVGLFLYENKEFDIGEWLNKRKNNGT